jgi:ethanolamine utilization protein EutQ
VEHVAVAPEYSGSGIETTQSLLKKQVDFLLAVNFHRKNLNNIFHSGEAAVSQVRHFQQSALQFQPYAGQDPERAAICRLIGPADSETMGAGLARFDGVSIEWTVLYDELIVVLEGHFRLRLADQVIDAKPGDVIWVPERTPLAYEGEKACVFYALYPVDWQARNA